ncbi:hypothetical protein DFR24_0799 [Panacagrimonas perspica]|uniref:Lectin n=1 Tax=Panacagrimonas perspica TaxID=381431 RepID=A0A4S3JZ42_9GAMM|nr:hypothetical protein [Panacagrimonas perspica]TDU31431.1 hypothetical protein DFR24_0799 [Panacagrimonas perspica]THD00836.1 hypothetical protein B1810_23260 [Panacagrimonas perspica]
MKSVTVRYGLLGLLLCSLAACQKADESSSGPVSGASPAAESAPVPAAEPAVTQAPPPVTEVTRFDGFGPARFGEAEESVRIAWGRPLEAAGSEDCRQLFAEPLATRAQGKGVSFMLVDGKFARYDIGTANYPAPGGAVVGDPMARVIEQHGTRVELQPHKYVEGAKTLIVTPEGGGDARLVFETSPDGTITRWRIGVPPAIFFVEGCS